MLKIAQLPSASASHSVTSNSLRPRRLHSPWNSLAQNTGVGSLSLLQEIFPTQELNPGLLHCRWILYQLSHKGSLFLNQALLCLCFFFLIQSIFLKILNLGSWDKNKAPHIEIFYNRELLPFLSLGRKQAKILCYVQDFETEHLRVCK